MSEVIKIVLPGRLSIEDLRAFIEEQSDRPANLKEWSVPGVEDEHFSIAFKDPFDRRVDREIRGHVSERVGYPHAEIVGDGEYTYFTLGESGNAEKIMTMIADRFGGHLWFDSTESGVWHEPDAASPTLR